MTLEAVQPNMLPKEGIVTVVRLECDYATRVLETACHRNRIQTDECSHVHKGVVRFQLRHKRAPNIALIFLRNPSEFWTDQNPVRAIDDAFETVASETNDSPIVERPHRIPKPFGLVQQR